jgi:hypothetical protein
MTQTRYTDIVSNRAKLGAGEYVGTVSGIRVRFVNLPCRKSVEHQNVNNWVAYRLDTMKVIAEGWESRLGAAQSVAYQAGLGRI